MGSIKEEIEEALKYLEPRCLTYDQWLSVGMALKNEGLDPDVWRQWSESDKDRFHADECYQKWSGFNRTGLTAKTIFLLCKEKSGHVVRSDRYKERNSILKPSDLPRPAVMIQEPDDKDWDPVSDIREYLILLFNPDDYIGYCVKSRWNEDRAKYAPQSREPGEKLPPRKQSELIKALDQKKDISTVFGDYNRKAGAWIMINPISGKPNDKGKYALKENVSDYRFCLVESDSLPVKDQIDIYEKMRLPVVCVTYSGARSAHAIVRVNAKDKAQYEERVQKIFDECNRNGLQVDTNNKDVSRLSRAPGFERNGHKQYLMCKSFGSQTYEDWESTLYVSKLPEPIPVNLFHDPPPKPMPIIEDTLNPEEVMLISGPPKAGKSFLTMQMALAVAEGRSFIGLKCRKGSVIYIDGELSDVALIYRVRGVMEKMGIQRFPDNLSICAVKNRNITLEDVISDIEHCEVKWDLVILDPYYVLSNVDENSNSELRGELKNLSRLTRLGSAVVIIHHQTKGSQAGKANIDRAAGGSTFARYADTVASLNLLERRQGDYGIPERFESDHRSFPPKNKGTSIDLMYNGIHFLDTSGELEGRHLFDPARASREKNRDDQIGKTNHVYHWMKDKGLLQNGTFTLKTFMESYANQYEKRDRKTVKEYLANAGFEHDDPGKGKEIHYWKETDTESETTDDLISETE